MNPDNRTEDVSTFTQCLVSPDIHFVPLSGTASLSREDLSFVFSLLNQLDMGHGSGHFYVI